MSFWYFFESFWKVLGDFYVLVFGALAGGILLCAMYWGRRGPTAAKGMPTYSPEFALGAFGFDMLKGMNKLQRTTLALVFMFLTVAILGIWYLQSTF